ncbi:SET domain-containing protein [Trichodelitschia bisporula]|uniref:SET domain-containing protein n=1 Tax=Trichodelitschia bisporula TaxID=703511 RepID=A0A6G1HZ95_9PEZI|nr:SET domain-containing protein [Trichodelitschia bisporula]
MIVAATMARTSAAEYKIRYEFIRRLLALRGAKPVRLVNTKDLSTPPLKFEFINQYIYREGVHQPDPGTVEGCVSCRENMGAACGCEYTKLCECLEYAEVNVSKLTEGERVKLDKITRQGGSTLGLPKRFPYSREQGILVTAYLDSRYPIYECNERCICGPICKTRMVQHGRQVGLEIFKTATRGWGLRCTEGLRRGQFIDVYHGEIVTKEVANGRLEAAGKGKESYLFQLDKFDQVLEGRGALYEVDGEYFGGPTRFINHSCEPNCRQYVVSYNKNDPYLYDIAFFAIRDIPPFEELTFDYLDYDGAADEDGAKEEAADSIPCRCGAEQCRKWLWK